MKKKMELSKIKYIYIALVFLLISGCSTKKQKSSIKHELLDHNITKYTDAIYNQFDCFEINELDHGYLVLESFQNNHESTILNELSLSNQNLQSIYLGSSAFEISDPGLASYRIIYIVNEEISEYNIIDQQEYESMMNFNYNIEQFENLDFELLHLTGKSEQYVAHDHLEEIDSIEKLHSFTEQLTSGYALYYVKEK